MKAPAKTNEEMSKRTAGKSQSCAVVQLKSVSKTYGVLGSGVEVRALRELNLSFGQGEYVAICGASGSGKSTLLNILGCLDRPSSGNYFLGDQDVAQLDDDELSEIRGQRIGFVFQSFNLIAQLNVLENVEVPLFYQGVSRSERNERARSLLDMVGLADRWHHRPNELSGGQMQRVAIARSLINDPLIILADEPTGNLDTTTGERILEVFENLHRTGKTIMMVTHEPDVANRCERMIVLKDGQIISDERNGHG